MGVFVSDVLQANPVWAAWAAERVALQEKRAALVRHTFDARAPYEQAVAEHRAAVAAAVDAGEVPPVSPEVPDLRHLNDAAAMLRTKEAAHQACKDEVLAEAAEDVLLALRDRESADNARLAMLAPEVHRLRARRVADLDLYAQVIGAQDRHAGLTVHPSRQERVSRDVTTDALLNAAEADVSLLAPVPMTGVPAGRVVPDDGRDESARNRPPQLLGMTGRGFGGANATWPRESRLPPGRV